MDEMNLNTDAKNAVNAYANKTNNNDEGAGMIDVDKPDIDEEGIKKMLEAFQKSGSSLPKKTYGRAYKKARKKKMKQQKKSRKLNRK
ncbi:MAG: hypothetical protein ACOC2W_00965 [bacterium]